jgi:glucan phosphoethanolaminetransferase (alkaline phosphatase superfamily)
MFACGGYLDFISTTADRRSPQARCWPLVIAPNVCHILPATSNTSYSGLKTSGTCSHTNIFCTLCFVSVHFRIKSVKGPEVLIVMAIGIIVLAGGAVSQVDVY